MPHKCDNLIFAYYGLMAQLLACWTGNLRVPGSSTTDDLSVFRRCDYVKSKTP